MRSSRCSKCSQVVPIVGFETFRGRNGRLYRRGTCKECRSKRAQDNFDKLQAWRKTYNAGNRNRKRQRDVERRDAARALTAQMKDKPCSDCGIKWPPVAMDFDHASGGKVKSIASMVGQAYKLDLIREEIAKCEVVCACCHRIRTATRRENLSRGRTIPDERTATANNRAKRIDVVQSRNPDAEQPLLFAVSS